MSEHKYNDAYSKGYRDGQKDQCLADAIDDALAMLDKLEVTNGDMIKAMFPNYKFTRNAGWMGIEIEGSYYSFCPAKFWDAPYKGNN